MSSTKTLGQAIAGCGRTIVKAGGRTEVVSYPSECIEKCPDDFESFGHYSNGVLVANDADALRAFQEHAAFAHTIALLMRLMDISEEEIIDAFDGDFNDIPYPEQPYAIYCYLLETIEL